MNIFKIKNKFNDIDYVVENLRENQGEDQAHIIKILQDRIYDLQNELLKEQSSKGESGMTISQRDALWDLCHRYKVPFREDDYYVFHSNAKMTPGYAEGWVGGRKCNGGWGEQPTIFVSVSPEGRINS